MKVILSRSEKNWISLLHRDFWCSRRLRIHLSLVRSGIEIQVSKRVNGQSERGTNRKNYAQVARDKSNV